MLFDTHAHIYDEAYTEDLDIVIQNAINNKIELILVPSDNLTNSLKAIELTKKYDFVFCSIGIHPSEIKDLSLEATLCELEKLSKNNKVKAIGEIGLDYYYYKDDETQNRQKKWFKKQIELANKLKLPIIVHSRDACFDTLKILDEVKPLYGCVFHCYSYSLETLAEVIKRGFYIGLDGPVTFKNAITPKDVSKKVPLDKLLIETDCPYLTPHPFRGKRNEPSYLIYIAQEIANLKGITYDELSKITYENGRKFFSI